MLVSSLKGTYLCKLSKIDSISSVYCLQNRRTPSGTYGRIPYQKLLKINQWLLSQKRKSTPIEGVKALSQLHLRLHAAWCLQRLTVQAVLVASVLCKRGVLPTSILIMVHYCCVVGCNSQSKQKDGTTFHRFPLNNKVELHKWVTGVRRKGWHPNNSSRICSKHFASGTCIII